MQCLKIVLIISFISTLACTAEKPKIIEEKTISDYDILEDRVLGSKQLLISIASSFSSNKGNLYLLEKTSKGWTSKPKGYKVNYGSNGMAWGIGLHKQMPGAQKKEGDKKSPAGVFEIGRSFGYPEKPKNCKTNYLQIDQHTQCIEDVKSKYYNTIVNNKQIHSDWNSTDLMLRKDDLFKYGFFVNHNPKQIPGKGSCIFFHLWRNAESFTAGCTALSETDMYSIISWLDYEKKPLLIQMPAKEYAALNKKLELPAIK